MLKQTATYAIRFAAALDLPEEERAAVQEAASIYDRAVPQQIAYQPRRLTFREKVEVNRHVLVSTARFPKGDPAVDRQFAERSDKVREIVRHHHERWDGKGFPNGLRGAGIPVGAQVLAIADAWEALTSDRPRRRAFSQEQASRQLVEMADKGQFNPELVQVFLQRVR